MSIKKITWYWSTELCTTFNQYSQSNSFPYILLNEIDYICQRLIEFFKIRISLRLSDRTKYFFSKIAPSGVWTNNLRIFSLEFSQLSQVTIWLWVWITKALIKSCSIDSRNKQSPTCKVVHKTKESSLQKSPTDSLLAQLADQETDDQELMSWNPTGGQFFTKFILFCVPSDLSDNLTEIRQISFSWKTRVTIDETTHIPLSFSAHNQPDVQTGFFFLSWAALVAQLNGKLDSWQPVATHGNYFTFWSAIRENCITLKVGPPD